ncbi:hypothetical protein [Aliarcobacter cryaerophilus]|uniref:hypothetical protein n=1 Tax=Aliarcobacter cryaerophilus TaxID=28198 RepID=UPI0021B4220E|nr:hypothetical protein [Aliarcobacter cryaerophilus]MCT7513716.1 hypothetical protein [Aliarcobacter cryaerophilus]
MANKIFEYGDIVYFLDSKGKIDTGTFSEDWVAGGEAWSFVNQRGHQIHVWTGNLFDSEINLLLSLEKEKLKEIETSKSLIVKNQNNLPVLEQELIEIKNRIKKIGE